MNQITGKIDEIIANVNSSASGTQYVITADIADGEQYLYFIQSDSTAIVTAKASTSVYNSVTNQTNRFVEDYTVKVRIDVGSTGKYVVIENGFTLLSGATYTIDIKKYITSAQSRLKIVIVGNTSGATVTWDGYVQQTTMSLTPSNVEWHKAFVEGTPFNFGSFTITGTLSKEVHVLLSGNGYRQEFIDNIGSRTYASNYYYLNMSFPNTGTGVYKAEIWVSSGTLESKHYSYNIMCVAREDATSARLVCVNEIGTDILNDASCYLFSYALYNCGGTNGNATIIMNASYGNQIHEIYNEEITASTGIKHQLNYFIGISSDDANIALNVNASNGNTFEHTFVIDNSSSFPSTSGAKFLMNPSTRSNAQSNRKIIINDASSVVNSTVSATWTRVSFTDGMDGWTLDDNGRSCLAINAGSKVVINRKMLSDIGNGKTIEFNYKVKNVSDYSENVITVAENENSSRFVGFRIRPDEICLHSKNLNTDDSKQSYHVQDEKEVNCVIVLAKNYRINYGNFAQIYVNGVIKCEFAFSDNDSFATNANIILGSDTADLFVYSIREYDTSFAHTDSHTNYVSSLPTREDKQNEVARDQSVVDDNGDIDFEKVKACANYFVMEMTGDKEDAPNYQTWTKKDVGYSNIEMHWYGHPEWDWIILGVETMGQGTTSMNYFRWNLRWRIDKTNKDKTCYIRYWNTTSNSWDAAALSKTVKFDGDNHTPIMRITAKKNYASSQQSHKMGTTAAYNDLHDVVVGENEAGGRTAVWQAPAYGFLKRTDEITGQPIYEFIGLFTIGADKGDKPTFAYDNKTYKSTLVTMEGVDHDKPVTMFKYQWIKLSYHGENLCIPKADGTYDNGFEVGNFCGLETAGTATDDAAVMDKMQTEFKDAYEVAYRNSPFIMGVDRSISEINSQVSTFRQGTNNADDFRPIQHYELYDSNYDLYYYDISSNLYESTGVNVKDDLGIADSELIGKTLYQKDLYFREKRRERFKANVGKYWDLEDTLFCFTFLIIFAATDNNGKNSYPYKFANKYRWRQDDLDTIFSTDNQGHDAKKYSVEFKDFTDDTHSAYAFKGEDSAFWTLIYECYPTEIRQMGYRILDGMVQLSSVKSGTTMQRLMGFFNDYYWSRAQNYFTKSAYNNDAKYSYEDAYPYYPSPYNPGVDPLEQSHGDSLEAEMYWVERRLIYCMSQYRYGAFSGYTDTSLGRIAFRTQLAQSFKLRPAMDLYPCILSGQGGAFYGGRTFDGTECEIINAGGSNTDVYIMGADYLRSIGDLCKLAVDATTNSGLTISSKRLEELKVGDVNPNEVTTNLRQLILDNCPSLLTIDARNLTRLTGELNLKNCQRVREVYLGGTDIRSVLFADGCKIQTFQLSDSMTSIVLNELKFLSSIDVSRCAASIHMINISGCDSIDALNVLSSVWNTRGNSLTNIRLTDFSVEGNDTIANMLYSISINKDVDGNTKRYYGIDTSGQPNNDIPYLSGTVHFTSIMSIYYDQIIRYFPQLTINADTVTRPSVEDIGLSISGDNSAMSENNVTSRQFRINARQEAFKAVTWSIVGNVTEASISQDGLLSFNARDIATNANITTYRNVTVVATSVYNSNAVANIVVQINSIAATAINLSVNNTSLNIGDTATITATLLPSTTTKGKYLKFETSDNSQLTVDNRGNVNVVGTAFGVQTVTARLFNVTKTINFALNDVTLIDASVQTEFTDLLTYWNQQGWCASATRIMRSEVSKPTSLGTKLRGNTSVADLSILEYFTNIKTLNANEFNGCTNLSVIDTRNIVSFVETCFRDCTSLVKIDARRATSITSAFYGCTSLQTVLMPLQSCKITNYTFTNCNSLDKVVIPSIDVYMSYTMDAFWNSTSSVHSLYNGTDESNCELLTDLVVPDNVTSIGVGKFYGNTALVSVDLNKVTSIGRSAFFNCENLEGVIVIPRTVTSIALNAFAFKAVKTNKVNAVFIHKGSADLVIDDIAFEFRTTLQLIDAPSNTIQWGNRIMSANGTDVLNIVCRATTPPTGNVNGTPKAIYVPSSSVDTYKSATGWLTNSSKIFAIGGTEWTEEFGSSFAYADYIKYGVEIPDLNEGKSGSDYMEFLDPEVERICVEN